MDRYDPSPASLRPLFGTFWSSAGWVGPNWPAADKLAAAVRRGVMFAEPRTLDHDGWVEAARTAAARIDREEVEEAFLASLTNRSRLDLRSALASYAVARHLPAHSFEPYRRTKQANWPPFNSTSCAICAMPRDPGAMDLNVLNFERFKWGGVRISKIQYVAFDLEQFRRAPRLMATPADIALGRAVLDYLRGVPAQMTANAAGKTLRVLKGNEAERLVLMDILGVCGILRTSQYPGYTTSFVPARDRDSPANQGPELAYPTCWWRGGDGVNASAVQTMLPRLA